MSTVELPFFSINVNLVSNIQTYVLSFALTISTKLKLENGAIQWQWQNVVIQGLYLRLKLCCGDHNFT